MPFRRHTIVSFSVIAALVVVVVVVRHISGSRIIASAITSDGVEMCIVQEFNWSPELFTTSFVYRKPQSSWSWFYYDHQDSYWGKGRASLDASEKRAVFYRGTSPAVTFMLDSETYTLHRWNRTLTGAQAQMPVTWSPQMSTYAARKIELK